jgi:hypothetical protein
MGPDACPYCGIVIRQKREDGRCVACGKPSPAQPSLRLPGDLRDFFAARRQLEYDASRCEAGRVTLLPLEKLRVQKYLTRPTRHGQVRRLDDDPHQEDGYYWVPAVNLVADCEGYDPAGLLVWLPEDGLFGTWQSDWLSILVFPGASWTDIAADPIRFINGAMGIGGVTEELKPWPRHPFVPP